MSPDGQVNSIIETRGWLAGERIAVFLTCSGHFFSHFYLLVLPPLFPLIKGEFAVSFTALGAVITARSIATIVAQYPMGVLVDRHAARFFLIGGLALTGGAVALMSVASTYAALVVLAFLAGLGDSVFHPANYAILEETISEKHLGRAYSAHTLSGNIGWAVAPAAVIFLTALWNWRVALGLLGVAGLVMSALLYMLRRRLRVEFRQRPAPARQSSSTPPISPLALLVMPPILLMFLFNTSLAAGGSGFNNFTPVVLIALYGVELATANAALTTFLVASTIGVVVGGYLADQTVRRELIVTVGFSLCAAAMLIVSTGLLPISAVFSTFFLAGFMFGVIMPSRDLIVRAITPPGATGKSFGLVATGYPVGGAVGPLFFGWMLDQGALGGVFVGVAALMIVAVAFGLLAWRFVPSGKA